MLHSLLDDPFPLRHHLLDAANERRLSLGQQDPVVNDLEHVRHDHPTLEG